MDQQQAERVNQLAKSLKDLHLASTTEEAYARAREVILGTTDEPGAKSIGQMFHEHKLSSAEIQHDSRELIKDETAERLDAKETHDAIHQLEKDIRAQESRLDEAHQVLAKARAILKLAREGKLEQQHEYWEKHPAESEPEPRVETYDSEEPSAQEAPEKNERQD